MIIRTASDPLEANATNEEIYQRMRWLLNEHGVAYTEAWIETCREFAAASLPFRIKE